MKKLFTLNIIFAALLPFSAVEAQITEAFNTRSLAPSLTDVKPFLEGQCWSFPDMDINQNGISPFEGNGTMVSGPAENVNQATGFITPLLDIPGSMDVYFRYKFNGNVTHNSWFKLYLTDYNNQIVQLMDSLDVTGASANTIYTYHKTLNGLPSGQYKFYWNFQGNGCNVSAGVDQFYENAPLYYPASCNRSPGAEDDVFAGNQNFTAVGDVLLNDFDPDNESITAELVTPSADGTVALNANGIFSFTPNAGFNGKSTTFQYKVWDNGMPKMSSNIANVLIDFTSASSLPVRFISVGAKAVDNTVTVTWVTESEVNNKQFEVQRSDQAGADFKTVGILFSIDENNGTLKSYQFKDQLKGVTERKLLYRIKQVDIDGKVSYSKIVSVNLDEVSAANSMKISPNPVLNNFNLSLEGKNKASLLRIIDIWGKEIYRQPMNGVNNTTLTLNAQIARMNINGVYMVELIYDDGTKVIQKIIKN